MTTVLAAVFQVNARAVNTVNERAGTETTLILEQQSPDVFLARQRKGRSGNNWAAHRNEQGQIIRGSSPFASSGVVLTLPREQSPRA